VRADSVALLFGTAHASRVGMTSNIDIVGYIKPDTPNINGPINGKVGEKYEFTVEAEDYYNDDLQYMIKWGNGNVTDWSEMIESGTSITFKHAYLKPGKYFIKAKAKDIDLLESDFAEYKISISKGSYTHNFKYNSFKDLYPQYLQQLEALIFHPYRLLSSI